MCVESHATPEEIAALYSEDPASISAWSDDLKDVAMVLEFNELGWDS